MAWTYDPADLNTTTAAGRLNVVRLLVGDTDTLDQQVQDEEVVFALAEKNNNVYFAGAWAANAIASKYSRKVNTELQGSLRADYSDLAAQYRTLSDSLAYQGKTSGTVIGVIAGGITKSGVEAVRANTDRIVGTFQRDRFKNPPSYNSSDFE
tara:strand:+ start:1217 stop:1672 length:456 start_codon:yes stop_codon:yes gene_type:complete